MCWYTLRYRLMWAFEEDHGENDVFFHAACISWNAAEVADADDNPDLAMSHLRDVHDLLTMLGC